MMHASTVSIYDEVNEIGIDLIIGFEFESPEPDVGFHGGYDVIDISWAYNGVTKLSLEERNAVDQVVSDWFDDGTALTKLETYFAECDRR